MSIAGQFPRLDSIGVSLHVDGSNRIYVDPTELHTALLKHGLFYVITAVAALGPTDIPDGWYPFTIEPILRRVAGVASECDTFSPIVCSG